MRLQISESETKKKKDYFVVFYCFVKPFVLLNLSLLFISLQTLKINVFVLPLTVGRNRFVRFMFFLTIGVKSYYMWSYNRVTPLLTFSPFNYVIIRFENPLPSG